MGGEEDFREDIHVPKSFRRLLQIPFSRWTSAEYGGAEPGTTQRSGSDTVRRDGSITWPIHIVFYAALSVYGGNRFDVAGINIFEARIGFTADRSVRFNRTHRIEGE